MDEFDAASEPTPTPDPADDDEFWGEAPAAPAAGAPAVRSTRHHSWRTWLVAGVGAAAIGGAAVAGIGAASSDSSLAGAAAGQSSATPGNGNFNGNFGGAPPGANGAGAPGAFGTISAIDGSTITLKDQSGQTTKVVTTASTTVTKTETVWVSDVEGGDRVVVTGTGSSTKIAATQVHDDGAASATNGDGRGPGGQGAPGNASNGSGFVAGTVVSVDGSSFTVKNANGDTVTVTTSSSTKLTKDVTVAVSDLAVGDDVMVVGTTTNGTVSATRIRDGVPAAGAGPLGGGPAGGPGGPGGQSGSGQVPTGSPQSA